MRVGNGTELMASWAATMRHVDQAVEHFWYLVEDSRPGLLPAGDAVLFLTGLGRLVSGGDDAAGRAALLAVLGRAYRRFCLFTPHHLPIGDALIDTVACYARPWWSPRLARDWQRLYRPTIRALARVGRGVGEGPAWWSAEVVDHDRPAPGIAILTVRPQGLLPVRPGQAVPVMVSQVPGRWRWYAPANAPRSDGSLELHVRAVPGGEVSHALVDQVCAGDRVWLGPPYGNGLMLDPDVGADLLLVAGGTGLAPLRALVEQVAAAPDTPRRVTLVVGSRNFIDLYDATSLDKLECAHDWLRLVPAVSHDVENTEPEERGDALTLALAHYRPGQEVYVCGPPAMNRDALLRLLVAGVPAEQIHL
ncbi:FAD-binding oxidoreductase, partial [Micromonospora sp. NPDC003197]